MADNPNKKDWVSPFESFLNNDNDTPSENEANEMASTENTDPIIGTPEQDMSWWDGAQSYTDTCAIRSQEFILEQFTGQEIDEHALVQEAMVNGWYTPGGGTQPEDVGNLLELHGVEVNRFENANIHTLANELAQGHKVIIGVDSGELWQQDPIREAIDDELGIKGADHALVVSGIDTTDPDNVQVIVSDPGTGEAAATYPMDQFLDAWQDSDFFMVATQDPAPSTLPEMNNFDYDIGHIPFVAGMPYAEFLTYEFQPEQWATWLGEKLGMIESDPAGESSQEKDTAMDEFAEEEFLEDDEFDEPELDDFEDEI